MLHLGFVVLSQHMAYIPLLQGLIQWLRLVVAMSLDVHQKVFDAEQRCTDTDMSLLCTGCQCTEP